jgi:hypothetical protein
MTRLILGTLAAALALASVIAAQAPADGPTLSPLWTVTAGFASPESAYYDPQSTFVFVSSINGQILEKDGNGYISKLTTGGQVVAEKWATGLPAPKGLRSVKGTLWVSDIDEVVGIEVASGRITARVKVEGAQFLNDLATAPDGTIYVSDSNQSRIYMVKDGRSSVFVEGAEAVEQPNGLLVDRGRLILGTIGPAPQGRGTPGPQARGDAAAGAGRGGDARAGGQGRGRGAAPSGHLIAFDLRTKARTLVTTQPVGAIDGIEPDGRGGLVVTDVVGQRLLHVTAGGDVTVLAKFSAGGADFGYVGDRRIAIVPFLFSNTVTAYDLTASVR